MTLGCPQKMCFNWRAAGTRHSSVHETLEDALSKLQEATGGSCGWHLGICIRKYVKDDGDFL